MKKSVLLFLSLSFPLQLAILHSQEIKKWNTGIEAGIDFSVCKEPSMDYIRKDRTLYGSGNAMPGLQAQMNRSNFGIRREFLIKEGFYRLSAGIRFSKTDSYLGKDNWSDNNEYFFLLYKQDGLTTQYLRVKDIEERCLYLGVPLEIKIFPYYAEGKRIYLKAGTEFNFLLQSDVDVSFYDSDMKQYAGEVEAIPEKPEAFESRLYGAIGLNFPRADKADINLEFTMPVLNLTPKSYGLLEPVFACGFQLSILFPF